MPATGLFTPLGSHLHVPYTTDNACTTPVSLINRMCRQVAEVMPH